VAPGARGTVIGIRIAVRSLVIEVVTVLLGAVLLVSAALAFLPGSESSWLSRMIDHVGTALTFDFGYSTLSRRAVSETVADAAVLSLLIIGATAVLLLVVGVSLGVLSATHPSSRLVGGVRRAFDFASGMPVLVWSTLIFLLAVWVWEVALVSDSMEIGGSLRVLTAAVLALLLGDRLLADMVRRVELSTREILAEPYMRTVRAAGLGSAGHLLRSLVSPVADLVASRSLFLIGGAIVVERVFSIPGLGFMVVDSLERPELETGLVLAASMALATIGVGFRVLRYLAVATVDARARA
jgi:peptide/nickel transport system permease protein